MLPPSPLRHLLLLLILGSALTACSKPEPEADIPLVKLDLGAYAKARTITASTRKNEANEPPFLNGWPEHVEVLLNGQQGEGEWSPREPQVFVFSAAAYTGIYQEAERTEFERQMRQLKRVTERESTARPTTPVPVFPAIGASQVFHSKLQAIKTPQLQGVRFITRYTQEHTPTTNEDIFYTFQGLSADGRYYISVFHPVTVARLPDTPFLDQSTAFIEHADPRSFNPELDTLDRLVQSIRITPPPKQP